jgi:predicted PurR-regulated permease PerM
LHEFAQVSRTVATATLVSAIAQGLLGGIGYYFAGLESIWLLIIATMLASLVPFVGATIVWIPCCIYLYYFKGSLSGAIFLAVYGFGVVSMVDNLIKPWILQGRTKLHPLLALLSVLGGVQALGPIGIFVGPMAVVFFQAALVMLQSELKKDPVGIYKSTPTPSITS